jgi:peptidoglycan hydrolase CwlO-like protein
MSLTEQQLLNLKEKVDDAKTQVSELTGQKNALMKQLKDDWSCKTIAEAETKLKGMENNISILEKKIEKGVEELEEQYTIDNE